MSKQQDEEVMAKAVRHRGQATADLLEEGHLATVMLVGGPYGADMLDKGMTHTHAQLKALIFLEFSFQNTGGHR
jgi:hypothetical protein